MSEPPSGVYPPGATVPDGGMPIRAEAAAGTPLCTTGGYRTRKSGGDYRGGTIGASPAYSATAHVADVSVDRKTGVPGEVRGLGHMALTGRTEHVLPLAEIADVIGATGIGRV